MVHWSWLMMVFIVGVVFGVATCICMACCAVAKAADEEAEDMFDRMMQEGD